MVTALARIEGHPVGFIANQPMVLAGAIDAPASEKAARMIDLCDAHDVPMIFLCDTPGLMVGPEVERTGLVRRSARFLTKLTHATTPFMTVVLRKAYGLGYYVMGSRPLEPALLAAWPTAEFGGMGLEGAVNIIYKKELEAIADAAARALFHRDKTEALKRANTALAAAGRFDVDGWRRPRRGRRGNLQWILSSDERRQETGQPRGGRGAAGERRRRGARRGDRGAAPAGQAFGARAHRGAGRSRRLRGVGRAGRAGAGDER